MNMCQLNLLSVAQAYDQHLNMILGPVEETITTVEIDDETYEEIIKVQTTADSKPKPMLTAFVQPVKHP